MTPQQGLLTGSSLGSVSDTRSYSGFGELSQYQATGSGSPLYTVTSTRDALGRITEQTETLQGVTTTTAYGYDPAGRLTDVTVDGTLAAHYEYDENGNRRSVTRPSGTVSGTPDAQDRLLSYGALTYTYTASGELQTATEGGNTTTYSYDPLGNLVSVTLPNGTPIEYLIDGQNRRVGKKVNGVLVQAFLYRTQLNPVAELDGTGTLVSRFVYGSRVNVPDYLVKGGVTYRILTDHLGSPRLIVDTATGQIAQRMDYDEFGQVTLDTAPGFQPFGFAGGLLDPHTGLLRFGARDYDPFTGRWTTKDPILFAGGDPNLYGYVLNNPTTFVDPSGLFVPQIIGGVIGAVAGGISASFVPGATHFDILQGIAVGAAAGVLSTIPIPGVNPVLTGAAAGLLGNLGSQIFVANRPVSELDPVSAGFSTIAGGFGGSVGNRLGEVLSADQIAQSIREIVQAFGSGLTSAIGDVLLQRLRKSLPGGICMVRQFRNPAIGVATR